MKSDKCLYPLNYDEVVGKTWLYVR